jgi:hypothetical protein
MGKCETSGGTFLPTAEKRFLPFDALRRRSLTRHPASFLSDFICSPIVLSLRVFRGMRKSFPEGSMAPYLQPRGPPRSEFSAEVGPLTRPCCLTGQSALRGSLEGVEPKTISHFMKNFGTLLS